MHRLLIRISRRNVGYAARHEWTLGSTLVRARLTNVSQTQAKVTLPEPIT
jgi:hypothetical protein